MHERERARPPSESRVGLAAIAGAAALWAIAAVVARDLFDAGMPPMELAEGRAAIAAVGLALIPTARRGARRAASGRRAGVALLAALGAAIALVNLTYYVAIDRVPVAVALVLQYTAPAMVVTWTAFRARRAPSRPVVAALVAALAGVVLVSNLLAGDLGDVDVLGVGMGLAAAVCFATYTLLGERAGDAYGTLGALLRGFAVATGFWVVVQAARGWPDALFELDHALGVMFVGVIGTLLPFLLYVWGIGRVRAERASIAATLEPVLGGIVAWVWLGQTLSPIQIAGGALVIVAVMVLATSARAPVLAPEP